MTSLDHDAPYIYEETDMITSDRIPSRREDKPNPPTPVPSQIEGIHGQLMIMHRRHDALDDFGQGTEHFSTLGEKAFLASCNAADDINSLTNVLTMLQPRTSREALICLEHIKWCLRQVINALPAASETEIDYGQTVARTIGLVAKFLEGPAGVTAEELGCTGRYFEDDEAPRGIEAPDIDELIKEVEAATKEDEGPAEAA
jgi:hypothetical protein